MKKKKAILKHKNNEKNLNDFNNDSNIFLDVWNYIKLKKFEYFKNKNKNKEKENKNDENKNRNNININSKMYDIQSCKEYLRELQSNPRGSIQAFGAMPIIMDYFFNEPKENEILYAMDNDNNNNMNDMNQNENGNKATEILLNMNDNDINVMTGIQSGNDSKRSSLKLMENQNEDNNNNNNPLIDSNDLNIYNLVLKTRGI